VNGHVMQEIAAALRESRRALIVEHGYLRSRDCPKCILINRLELLAEEAERHAAVLDAGHKGNDHG
jgi:hypothetical protein